MGELKLVLGVVVLVIFLIPFVYANELNDSSDQQGTSDEDSIVVVPLSQEEIELLNSFNGPYEIRFGSGVFVPKVKMDPRLYTATGNYTYAYIMINGTKAKNKRSDLENISITILNDAPYTYNTYYVRLPLDKLDDVENLSFVRYCGYIDRYLKFMEGISFRDELDRAMVTGELINIEIFLAEDNTPSQIEEYKTILKGEGITIYKTRADMLWGNATSDSIEEITKYDFVRFISRVPIVSWEEESDGIDELGKERKKVVYVLSNSIDRKLSTLDSDLGDGILVKYLALDSLDLYKNRKYILVLGGQDAPEGIGFVSGELLTDEEKMYLRTEKENKIVSVTSNKWVKGQSIILIAGYDRYSTKKAQEENINFLRNIIDEIQ